MSYAIELPKEPRQAEEALKTIIQEGRKTRNIHAINWWIAHYYLQGARSFSNVNYQNGTLSVSYLDDQGVLSFRLDDIVAKFQTYVGRLVQMDFSPSCEKGKIGVEDMRKASIAQVALASVMTPQKVDALKLDTCTLIAKYGVVGLGLWAEEDRLGIDVVPPWELLPVPPNPVEDSEARGIIRVRTVPLRWLKKMRVTPGENAEVWKAVETWQAPVGTTTEGNQRFNTFVEGNIAAGTGTMEQYGATGGKRDKTQEAHCEMAEIYLEDGEGYLREYIITAGTKIVYRDDQWKGKRLSMPLQKANGYKTGGFWGRGFVGTLVPLNQEMEYAVAKLLQNIQDLDVYGILCEPTTMGMPAEAIRGHDGIKRLRFEPDYTVPDLKPFALTPVNSGPLPVKVLETVAKLSNQLANQPDELLGGKSPGRVDSQSALGFLYETSNIPITPTAFSISQAVGGVYRSMLGMMKMVWPREKVIAVSMLDDTIAGITFDTESGTMSLADNAIPSPEDVKVGIKAMMPKSKEQEKMELKDALATGAMSMKEYRIEVRKRGLDLPVGDEVTWQNYRRAVMENIQLFGDGQKPGRVTVDDIDDHEVHMMVLRAFMARPEFFHAGGQVRTAFKEHYNSHHMGLGAAPDQLPYPEDAAEDEMMRQQLLADAGGPLPAGLQEAGLEGDIAGY